MTSEMLDPLEIHDQRDVGSFLEIHDQRDLLDLLEIHDQGCWIFGNHEDFGNLEGYRKCESRI